MKHISFERENQALAALLKDLRVALGITQEQLAESLRWRQTDVSKVERCARQLGHVELRYWVSALGIDMFGLEMEFQARLASLGIPEPAPPGGRRNKRQTLR